jgi:hypothetical protein
MVLLVVVSFQMCQTWQMSKEDEEFAWGTGFGRMHYRMRAGVAYVDCRNWQENRKVF